MVKKWALTHRIVHKSIGSAGSQFLGIVHDSFFTHNFTVSSAFQVVDPSFWRESQYLYIWHHFVENTEIKNFHEHAYQCFSTLLDTRPDRHILHPACSPLPRWFTQTSLGYPSSTTWRWGWIVAKHSLCRFCATLPDSDVT